MVQNSESWLFSDGRTRKNYCLAETGSARRVDTTTNVACGSLGVALGEAEWAATQTVHFAASVAFECWCVADANADQKVSSMQNHAMRFELDRKSIAQ